MSDKTPPKLRARMRQAIQRAAHPVLPAPIEPPDLCCVHVTNKSAEAYDTYVKSLPAGPIRFVLQMAPRKNVPVFPDECPSNTIALLEMNNEDMAVIRATTVGKQKPVLLERPGKERVK